jgi:pimeloyl-ACP methyl ester carboxylesterase
MPFLNANGVRTRYEIEGEGPALLLIAGNGMDRTCFKDQVPEFAKHFRCIAYDMRGIGESDVTPADYGTREMAADALALLNGLKIERAHVAGYSLGGCIGQEMALALLELGQDAAVSQAALRDPDQGADGGRARAVGDVYRFHCIWRGIHQRPRCRDRTGS